MATATNTDICWRLVLPDGTDWDQGDGVPHFPTEKEAMERFEGEEALPDTKAVPFAAPCVTVSCDECEVDVGNDDVFSEIHCQGVTEALTVARASDWTVLPDGRTYCWDCPVPDEVPA